jgi:hypothetical protein
VEKVWDAHYTLGARYISKNTVIPRKVLFYICTYDIKKLHFPRKTSKNLRTNFTEQEDSTEENCLQVTTQQM